LFGASARDLPFETSANASARRVEGIVTGTRRRLTKFRCRQVSLRDRNRHVQGSWPEYVLNRSFPRRFEPLSIQCFGPLVL
jgi:hypothetical protein